MSEPHDQNPAPAEPTPSARSLEGGSWYVEDAQAFTSKPATSGDDELVLRHDQADTPADVGEAATLDASATDLDTSGMDGELAGAETGTVPRRRRRKVQ